MACHSLTASPSDVLKTLAFRQVRPLENGRIASLIPVLVLLPIRCDLVIVLVLKKDTMPIFAAYEKLE